MKIRILIILSLVSFFVVSCRKNEHYAQPKDYESLYVLEYHSVVAADSLVLASTMISSDKMEADLKWLSENGYTTVLPRELIGGIPLSGKTVILSFDDGYRDNYECLFPLLKKYNMKAVINVLASSVVSDERRPFLSWRQCREMSESGLVEIGSHTYNLHNPDETAEYARGISRMTGECDDDYYERVMGDLRKSVQIIEENVGTTVVSFAYPYGITSKYLSPYIDNMFPVTFCSMDGVANISEDFHMLPRYVVTTTTSLESFME